jgi:hypothetical protein
MVGSPVNWSAVNLNAAPDLSPINASKPLAVSKAEVDPKAQAEIGPSIDCPR